MAFDVNFALQVMLPAANAAYQIMNNPAPPLPAGYALVGEILADPEQAANATAAATPLMQGMVAGMLLESPICGLVAWNAATATALVSFRGTQTIQDWAHNLDAAAVFYIPTPGDGLVHMGFQLVYEHLAANVRILLSKCVGMKQILVTGHSLGGAVAILGAGFCFILQQRHSGALPDNQYLGSGATGSTSALHPCWPGGPHRRGRESIQSRLQPQLVHVRCGTSQVTWGCTGLNLESLTRSRSHRCICCPIPY